jgi:RNA polymerase sigma factor (sigma-70 family)
MNAAELTDERWEGLIRLYDHTVFISLLSSGIKPLLARELCHDTWSRLYERWREGRLDLLQLPGLAVVQARYLALDAGRRLRAPRAELDEVIERSDGRASPEERVAARQTVERVESALDDCPKRARALFELALTHPDVPHAQLAERSGISTQRLRQTLCEVRARLRAALEEEEA